MKFYTLKLYIKIQFTTSLLAVFCTFGCGIARGEQNQFSPSSETVTLADVMTAQKTLQKIVLRTPLVREQALSQLTGGEIYLKLENLQLTGSFKIRGAFNKMASLSQSRRARGVVTASAGNHAQGVALAAERFKIKATIVMPETVPTIKLEATRRYGPTVLLYGKNFDEALAKAREIESTTGATFIHPFDDPLTIAGQGTIGMEIMQDLPDADLILVPVGGGGLLSGIIVAVKGIHAATGVIGVEPAHAPSMEESLRRNKPTTVTVTPTLADGTAVARPGLLPFDIIKRQLDGLITVSEEEISAAVRLLLLKDKVLTEGAGALGAAALLSGKIDVKGKKVVVILSGGNIDEARLVSLLMTDAGSDQKKRPAGEQESTHMITPKTKQ